MFSSENDLGNYIVNNWKYDPYLNKWYLILNSFVASYFSDCNKYFQMSYTHLSLTILGLYKKMREMHLLVVISANMQES